ncbi:MAG TPA: ATP-binding protein [Bryobacteraceae bacterium]|nr:ATP-binding protein [Bryobacteraceae bacterium]
MENESSALLFGSGLWERALESYAAAAHLTVELFGRDGRLVLGPVHSTPLFQLFAQTNRYDPGIFAECARRCLTQTDGRPAVVVSQIHGLSVIGTSLALEGEVVGAVVGGYAFVDFSQLSEIQWLARNSGIAFERLWRVAREQKPVSQARLVLNGELLQVLGDALLRENYRTRQYEEAVLKLEEAARVNAQTAAALHTRNDDLNQFAFAASHDLQEPLRMIASYSQLLVKTRGEQLDEKSAVYVGFIKEGAERMRTLLADLRAYIQIAPEENEPVGDADLNRALEDAGKNLKTAIGESRASVTSDILPAVRGQHVHFVQLFQNLIGNAIKYRGAEAPRIHVSAQKCNREWRVAVADNGMGIAPEYHQVIFGVFKRLHGRKIPGTGLGLAICQRIVAKYGGRIWVESQPGAGATFYFTLPLQ